MADATRVVPEDNTRNAIAEPAIVSATGADARSGRPRSSRALDITEGRLQNIHHAFVRIRVPRLRPPFRVSDAGTGDAELSCLRQRRAREAAVGIRRRERPLILAQDPICRPLRNVRRPARPRRLLHQLAESVKKNTESLKFEVSSLKSDQTSGFRFQVSDFRLSGTPQDHEGFELPVGGFRRFRSRIVSRFERASAIELPGQRRAVQAEAPQQP